MSSKLLRGGTVLVHDEHDHVNVLRNTDVLIQGNKIVEISPGIQVPEETEIINCADSLISPGLIDTHHHVWQTQLKGRHANELLLEYFYSGNFNSSVFSADDIFWGQLGGAMEMVNGGTTCVVDHAHLNYGPEYNAKAISATVASGVRSIYGYCPTARVASWNPLVMDNNILADEVINNLEELASTAPFGDGRVTLGLAFDGWFLPKRSISSLFGKVAKLGIRTITSHSVRTPSFGASSSLPKLINSYGLLDDRFLFSHSNNMTPEEVELCHSKGFWISSTPDTELQMAHGSPVCFDDKIGVQSRCSLGVDCHSNNSGDLLTQMRLALQSARGRSNEKFNVNGKDPRSVYKTVEEAFNLGTIQGARAVHMQDQIGSIAVGKVADLVIFDATSVAMVCAAQHDPVAAIVLHSSPGDIDTVIIDGHVRKRNGRLLPVHLDDVGQSIANKETLEWKEVAKALVKGREEIQKKIETHDVENARKVTVERLHINESKICHKVDDI
ncbi:Metallo-dependent hydrolase, partial [Aureobasidium melanogenum]